MRQAAGITHADLEAMHAGSISKWKRIERGATRVSPGDVALICRICKADEETTEDLFDLSQRAEQSTWTVDQARGLPNSRGFSTYLELEQFASGLSVFGPALVPGIAQTRATQAAQFSLGFGYTEDIIERQIEVRTKRQEQIPDLDFLHIVIGEEVLHRQVGGASALAEQIQHLRTMSARPNVEVRVLPFSAGAHPGGKGEFTILDFPEHANEPSLAYADGYLASQYSADDQVVANLRWRFATIWDTSVPIEEHLR